MLLRLENISTQYYTEGNKTNKILNNITLHIQKAAFVILVGSNGAGKSTLLQLIAGDIKPSQGDIYLDNKNINSLSTYQRAKWITRLFQNPLLSTAPNLTILENFLIATLRNKPKYITWGLNTKFKNKIKEKIAILQMGLENNIDKKIGLLSGGQRQALALFMCVITEPPILLLDEPTAALDPSISEKILSFIELFTKEYQITTIMATHQIKDMINIGNRLIQLQQGNIIKDMIEKEKKELTISNITKWF